MKQATYRDNAMWGRTARMALTPAEYACAVERCRTGLPFARIASIICFCVVAVFVVVLAVNLIARSVS